MIIIPISALAEKFQSTDIYKVKEFISKLKSQELDYKVYKKQKKVSLYLLLLRDSKRYRNLKIKRVKKVFFKNKLFFVQYSNFKKENIKKALKLFTDKGIYSTDLVVVRKKQEIRLYTVRYTRLTEPEVNNIATDESIATEDDSEISSDVENESTSYKLAQSQIKIEKQLGEKNSYDLTYGNLLTGIEFENDNFSAKMMGRVEYFDEGNSNDSFQESLFEIDETYVNFEIGEGQLTVGKQLFSWGTFDEFSNLDRVNIKNSPRFIFDSGEAYRRPITSVRYEFYSGDWKIDSFLDFGLESGKKMNQTSLWSGLDSETGRVRGGDPLLLNPLLVKNVSTHFKGRDESGYGIRLTYSGWGDLSFTYLNAYPDLPILEITDTLRQQILLGSVNSTGLSSGVNFSFIKENVYGIDFTKTISGQLYKLEYSYIPDSLVLTSAFELIKVPKSRLALGGDLEFDLFSTTLTWQVISESISTVEDTLMDKSLVQYVLNSSSRFVEDKLEVGIRYVNNQNDKSSYLSPYLNYDFSDTETIGLSSSIFSGSETSFFGYHGEDQFITMNITKLF
jgi:hypothetical protein